MQVAVRARARVAHLPREVVVEVDVAGAVGSVLAVGLGMVGQVAADTARQHEDDDDGGNRRPPPTPALSVVRTVDVGADLDVVE